MGMNDIHDVYVLLLRFCYIPALHFKSLNILGVTEMKFSLNVKTMCSACRQYIQYTKVQWTE